MATSVTVRGGGWFLRVGMSACAALMAASLDDGALAAQATSVQVWGAKVLDSRPNDDGLIAQIDMAEDHAVLLLTDGTVVAQGSNVYGQCLAPQAPAGTTFVDVAAGKYHSLALRSDGEIMVWGQSTNGQYAVPPLPLGLTYVDISAGDFFSVALRSDGALVPWGANLPAVLFLPPPLPVGVSYVSIDCGTTVGMAVRSDGLIDAWGSSTYGHASIPPLPAGLSYVAVDAGSSHALAIRSDGTVVGWGGNTSGQLAVPDLPIGETYLSVASGNGASAAVRSDGALLRWGALLPDPFIVESPPAGLAFVSAHAAGARDVLGLLSDHTVHRAGSNSDFQLGLERLGSAAGYSAVAAGRNHVLVLRSDGRITGSGDVLFGGADGAPSLPAGVVYTAIAAGSRHSVALTSAGDVVAWGETASNQTSVPVLPAGVQYVSIASGNRHSLALRSDGVLIAWGRSNEGQLVCPPPPAGASYAAIRAGLDFSVALFSNGEATAWGLNTSGQTNIPAAIPGNPYVALDAGDTHVVLLRADGTLVSVGGNYFGQLGLPSVAPNGLTYVEVACSLTHTTARLSDGSLLTTGTLGSLQATPAGLGVNCTATALDAGASYSMLLLDCASVPTAYCTSGVSSSGCSASISASGAPDVTASSGFTILVSDVEPQRQGLIFYGINGRVASPWGAGGSSFLCVKSPSQRMSVQSSGGTIGACDGTLQQDWLAYVASHPSALGVPFAAGQVVQAQGWYRDPPAVKSTSLSNALEFTLE